MISRLFKNKIYKATGKIVCLYRCEKWSLTLKDEYKRMVPEIGYLEAFKFIQIEHQIWLLLYIQKKESHYIHL